MLFKPTDEVLDQEAGIIGSDNQPINFDNQNYASQGGGQLFHPIEEPDNGGQTFGDSGRNVQNMVQDTINIDNIEPEKVESRDFSELLKETDDESNTNDLSGGNNENITNTNQPEETKPGIETGMQPDNQKSQTTTDNQEIAATNNSEEAEDLGKSQNFSALNPKTISDEERINIISNIEGSIHSNLDLLVDEQRNNIVNKYKKVHRLVFRWGMFSLFTILGVLAGVLFQVNAGGTGNYEIVKEDKIENKSKRIERTPVDILGELKNKGVNVNVLVPYGSTKIEGNTFLSKSNLISYNGLILPQVTSIDYQTDKFSPEDFQNHNITRGDLENVLNYLIMDSSIYKKTKSLAGPTDIQWQGQTFQGGLIEGFSLNCLTTHKLSDFFCDKNLNIFYKYGKYYDLSQYTGDLLILVKELKDDAKDIKPICEMIKEYTRRSGIGYSEDLYLIMNYCGDEDKSFYKKMTDFIEIENSLNQPQLPDKIFEDPDLNAYKLVSSRQSIYKILDGTALNKNYIISYLNFVQNLINKDKGTGRYLSPIYKDLLYIFNTDKLYNTLLQKGELSSDIKSQIDQINNGNSLYGYTSLSKLVTTAGVVESNSDFTGSMMRIQTIDEIFSQYYSMTDRLKIKKVETISDEKIKTQTEIFSDKILKVTDGESLKATVSLYRSDNVLYVENIKIANQQKLSDILNIRVANGEITFYAMLGYIEEQIGFWYDSKEETEDIPKPTLCDDIQVINGIDVYNCDESSIVIYKGDTEYNFIIENGKLISFTISDKDLDSVINDKLNSIIITKDNTLTIIKEIIAFEKNSPASNNMDKKLQVVNQFRMHFKMVPEVTDIEGKDDEFLVTFTLGEFNLQGNYNINTHMLTKISYIACDKTLQIKNLTIEISANNESQLTEILNNPRIFFVQANQTAYKKYLKMCE